MTDESAGERPANGPSGRHASLWLETSPGTDYGPLADGLRVDTAVVGGGIAGLSTAAKLVEAGQEVAVLERDRIVTGVTGHTTAKLTALHGLIYDHLLDHFGEESARQYADANETAIEEIAATIDEHDIECGFARAPSYTYVESRDRLGAVHAEVDAARRAGLSASFTDKTDLPYEVAGAVTVPDQAYFHPRLYFLGLAAAIVEDGVHVFEETTVRDVTDGEPCRVATDRGGVHADDVVLATHYPLSDPGPAMYFARMYPKRSYVLAARLPEETPDGMYYDPGDPYFSVRPHATAGAPLALFGGQNHRTGEGGDTTARYRALERTVRNRFDVETVEYRWSTQDFVTSDRIPFVGSLGPHADHVYVATGFGGWGMTNGTAAGIVLRDLITGRENEWADLYRPTRVSLGASLPGIAANTASAISHLVGDRVKRRESVDASDLGPDEGKVYRGDAGPVGVYRDAAGALHGVAATCPHMGCLVHWNDAESSWDCPCHGSRFDVDGSVLNPPAVEDLDSRDVAPAPDVRERPADDD